eukprot:TRINITY_DN13608_c0_g1_i5.p1 TRINITY_DN13608_c0_g1~~TRINITY_DN13608_c0_g1_i5.p1  ORF type:complete len:124 (+),score=11.26 TRINITY_DN13608_c0_g1_i5:128-499(+)
MGPTFYGSTITRVDEGSPTGCGVLISDQTMQWVPLVSSTKLTFPYSSRLRLIAEDLVGHTRSTLHGSITPKVAHGPPTGSLDQIYYPVDHGVPQPISAELSEMGSILRVRLLPWVLFEIHYFN